MAKDNIDKQGPGRPHEELPARLREKQDEPHVRGRRRYGVEPGTDMSGRRKAPAGAHEAFPGRPTSRPVPGPQSTRPARPCALDELDHASETSADSDGDEDPGDSDDDAGARQTFGPRPRIR